MVCLQPEGERGDFPGPSDSMLRRKRNSSPPSPLLDTRSHFYPGSQLFSSLPMRGIWYTKAMSRFACVITASAWNGLIRVQYKPGVFKVANIDGWAVIAAGAQYIDEVRKAPDEVLSFVAATEQVRLLRSRSPSKVLQHRIASTNQVHPRAWCGNRLPCQRRKDTVDEELSCSLRRYPR